MISKKLNSMFAMLALVLAPAQAFADLDFHVAGEGHGGGNGGDPVLLRTKLIKEYINTELRGDALAYMSNLQLDTIASPTAKNALKQMLEKDVLTDIRASNYVLQSSCKSIGGQEAGGAINGDLGGDICLSPKRLAELDSTKAEIVGLAIHEHAHHFGYDDTDNEIYKAVYKTVGLANPAWNGSDGNTAAPSPAPAPVPASPSQRDINLDRWIGIRFAPLMSQSPYCGIAVFPRENENSDAMEVLNVPNLLHPEIDCRADDRRYLSCDSDFSSCVQSDVTGAGKLRRCEIQMVSNTRVRQTCTIGGITSVADFYVDR